MSRDFLSLADALNALLEAEASRRPTAHTTIPSTSSSELPESDRPTGTNKLVIAIDFGTTYIGVAFAHTANTLDANSSNESVQQAVEKILSVRDWPSPNHAYPEKYQMILAYNQDGTMCAWGGAVNSTHERRVKFFKLALEEGVMDKYTSDKAADSLVKFNYPQDPALANKTPVDFSAEYLKAVVDHIHKVSLPKAFSREVLANQDKRWIITVPAIWSDKAKDATRKAAAQAGIDDKELDIVTEPEAAALYCATLCQDRNLEKGDVFLICDAGGGTVVIILE